MLLLDIIFTSNHDIKIISLWPLLWPVYLFFSCLILNQTSGMLSACNGSAHSCLTFYWEFWLLIRNNNAIFEVITKNRFFTEQSWRPIILIKSFHVPCGSNCSRVELCTILCPTWLNLHVLHDLILLTALWGRFCDPYCLKRKPTFRRICQSINPMSPQYISAILSHSTCFPLSVLQSDGNSGRYKIHYSVKSERNMKKYIVLTQ